MVPMNRLPNELLVCIFSFIPDYHYVLANVCKRWYYLLRKESKFKTKHYLMAESLSLLQWAVSHGMIIDKIVIKHVVSIGSREILAWIDSQNKGLVDRRTYHNALELAASRGYIDIVEWIINRGYSDCWRLCDYAAENGQFEMLKWLYNKGYPVDIQVCFYAQENGDPAIIEWIKKTCLVQMPAGDVRLESGNYH